MGKVRNCVFASVLIALFKFAGLVDLLYSLVSSIVAGLVDLLYLVLPRIVALIGLGFLFLRFSRLPTSQTIGNKPDQKKPKRPWSDLAVDSPRTFEELKVQFYANWDVERLGHAIGKPVIKKIIDVHQPGLEERFNKYGEELRLEGTAENPGNKQQYFHGTKTVCGFKHGRPCRSGTCISCLIIKGGFKMEKCSPDGGYFGRGLYTTPSSSTACRYARNTGRGEKIITGVVIVTGVALGKAEVVYGGAAVALKGSSCSPGYHSRIVKDAYMAPVYKEHAARYGEALLKSSEEVLTCRDESFFQST